MIAPYARQCHLLQELLNKASDGAPPTSAAQQVEIGTVEYFQGREKKIIIMSCVRTGDSMGFLSDHRRLNVALSRAQCGMIVIGNFRLMQKDRKWREVIELAYDKNCVVQSAPAVGMAAQ